MTFRTDSASKGRARADEDKARVRQAFVSAGRKLLSEGDPSKVSLRRIAAEAGYSPGTIYSYFSDWRALYRAVRERDMEDAVAVFEMLVSQQSDPFLRLRDLFIGTVDYWLKNPEHFDVLFAMPVKESTADDAELFGQTPVVVRALSVYYDAIQVFFDSLPRSPMSPRLAADALLAAVYGLIAFPRMTQTMKWSGTAAMAEVVVDSILREWQRLGQTD
jgi:AcrR family transcriptional regulator